MPYTRLSAIQAEFAYKVATARKSLLLPLLMVAALVAVVFSGSSVHSSGSFTGEVSERNGVLINSQDGSGLPGTNAARAATGSSASPTGSTPGNNFLSLSTSNESATTEGGERADLNHSSVAAKFFPSMVLLPSITAGKVDAITDSIAQGGNGDGNLDPGEKITYTVTISNTASAGNPANNATHLIFSDTIDSHTALVPGSVNAQPIAGDDTYTAIGNVGITVPVGSGLLSNDLDPDGDSITASAGATSTNSGNVSVSSDGSFTYNPPPGFEGADTFTYTVTDSHGTTATGTVTINITGMIWFIDSTASPCTTLALGCGRLSNPFSSLLAFNTLNNGTGNNPAANDNIFLYERGTDYTGPVTLLNGQRLIGQDATASLDTIAGITLANFPFTNALPGMNSGNATIVRIISAATAITLASGNTIRGLTVGDTVTDISGSSFGTLTVADVSLLGTGQALDLTTGALSATFNTITSTSGPNGISLTTCTGTLTGAALANTPGSLSGSVNQTFKISGGSVSVTYNGSMSRTAAGRIVEILNHTSGAISLGGAITASTSSGGIFLDTNLAGANTQTVDFTGVLSLTTTANDAFTAKATAPATSGGTVTATATTNTITTTLGTALNVVSTNIGAGGLKFQSITAGTAASGPTNAIILNNTGNSGGLSVTGTGTTDGSGGTIQKTAQGALFTSTNSLTLKNMNFTNANSGNGTCNNIDTASFNSGCQAAINMDTVSTVTFDNLDMNGGSQIGINGRTISTLSILNTTVTGFGNAVNENAVRLWNLTGTCAITNSSFSFPSAAGTYGDHLVDIRNNTSTALNLTVQGNPLGTSFNTFSQTQSSTNGASGLSVTGVSSSKISLYVKSSKFLNLRTNGIQTFARDSSTMNVDITGGGVNANGNTFDPVAASGEVGIVGKAIDLSAEDNAILHFNIKNNPKLYARGGPVVNVIGIGNAVLEGKINDNPDIRPGKGGGALIVGNGIFVHPEDNASGIIEISNNTLSNVGEDQGINAQANHLTATLDVRILNNNITMVSKNDSGIYVLAGATAGDSNTTCAYVSGNHVDQDSPPAGNENYGFLTFRATAASSLYLQGFTTNTLTTWNNNLNTVTAPAFSTFDGGPFLPNGGVPNTPPYNGQCRAPQNTDPSPLMSYNFGATPTEFWAQSGAVSPFARDAMALWTGLALASDDPMPTIPQSERLNEMLASQSRTISSLLAAPINEHVEASPSASEVGAIAARVGEAVSSAPASAEVAVAQPAGSTMPAMAVAGPLSTTTEIMRSSERATVRQDESGDAVALARADNRPDKESVSSRTGKNRDTVMMSHAVMTRSRTRALAAAALVGPTFTVDGGVPLGHAGFTLPGGKSFTVTFQVTLNVPPDLDAADLAGGPHVSNQGTVSADGGITMLTNDTDTGTPNDPTNTPVDLYNAQVAVVSSKPGGTIEGESVTFTATVTPAPSQPGAPSVVSGSVDFFDGPAIPANLIAGCDDMPFNGSSEATCTTTALTSGGSPHTITAQYNGDGNFDINTGTFVQIVNPCTNNPVVNSTADPGDGICNVAQCTLREAIQVACVGSTITFDIGDAAPDTIVITSTLVINKNLNIANPNSGTKGPVTISANGGNFGVFRVDSPVTTFNISDLTITGVNATSISGGGLLAQSGTVTLTGMLFTGNTVINGDGGAVTAGSSSTVNIRNSTISGNTARHGGGLFSSGGTFNLLNVTVTNNNANGKTNAGACVAGGGVNGAGGGIETGVNTTNVKNSIVAGNTACDAGTQNISGTITAGSSNNIVTGDPRLAALAPNGGPTQTHALLIDSPALDAGDNCVFNNTCAAPYNGITLTTDQRGTGFTRKADSADADATQTVDIGAFEAQATVENITDKSTPEDTLLSFGFNVGDAGQITSVTASSGDATLVPNDVAHINITGSGSTRTLNITPASNLSGTSTITVTVTSGSESMSDTFLLTVNSVNDAPTLALISDPPAILEDAGLQTVNLSGISAGPANESGQTLAVTATSDNTGLIPNPTVTYTSPNATGSLSYTPVANQSGTAHITVRVTDNGGTANTGVDFFERTFTVTVTGVNDAPTLDPINNATINEDAGAQTVNLSGISAGPSESQTLTVTATSSNTGLIPDPTVTYTSPNATGSLSYTPVANQNGGPVTITVKVMDNGGTANSGVDFIERTFTVTVNSVNDAPTLALISDPPAILEDAGLQTVNLSGISAGPANESGQTLAVTATSDNTGLIPNPTVTYTSPNATGSLSYTPVANQSGTAHITVRVTDNGGTANTGVDFFERTFTVTVDPINDPPSFNKGADESIAENAGLQTVNGWATAISQGPNETGQTPLTFNVSVTGTTGNLTFSTPPAIDATTGTLTYAATNGTNGTADVSVTLSDSGPNTPSPNSNTSAAQTFQITVSAVNDAPVNTVPGALSIPQNTVLTFNGVNLISVADTDAAEAPSDGVINVSLSATDGTLKLSGTTNLTFTGGADNSAAMAFDGTIPDINAALNGMTFTPTSNFTGAASVQIVSDDKGKTGSPGAQTATDTVAITVNALSAIYINEVLFNPPGTDAPNEYIELRGPASSVIPAGTYLVAIEGDGGADNPGDVQTILNLSGLSFGTNGFLVLLQNGNTYTTQAGANVITSTTTGFGGLNGGGVWSADGGATDIEDASVTFMLIQTQPGVGPTLTDDIDSNNDAIPDGSVYAGWAVLDSIGVLDGSDTADRAYGAINYSNNTGTNGTATGTTVLVGFTATYVGRIGDSTGFTAADWVASGTLGGAAPNLTLGIAIRTEPSGFADKPLNHIGASNFANLPPVNSVPAAVQSVNEDTTLTFNAANSNLISISDPDAGTAIVQVTLTATNGTMSLSGTAVLTFTPPGANNDGTNDTQMVFTGTIANINTALNGMTFKPTLDYNGPASIQIVTDDQGNTGVGGNKTDTDTITINVVGINDAPTLNALSNATIAEDAGTQNVNLSGITAGPGETQTLSVTASSSNTSIIPDPSVTYTSPNSTGSISYAPVANANGGPVTITVTVMDNGGTAGTGVNSFQRTFTVSVTAINDAPTFQIASDPPSVNEDAGAQTVNSFATGFQPGPADESGQTLVGYAVTQTTTTGNLTFTSGPSIDTAGVLTYTPTGNTSGTATYNAVATDSGSGTTPNVNQSAPVTFKITVNAINDAPVLDNAGNMSLNAINEDVPNASNNGTLVSDIILSAGGDRITDVDSGAVEGIAVTGVDNTNGTWQFSIDNGTNWTPFGTPDSLTARLLASNATTRVRFIPNTDFNGTVNPGITFRAWDQSSGTNGNTADTSTVGGTTAFSTATETASITVNAVNDAPTAVNDTLSAVAEDSVQRIIPFSALTGNDLKGPANESGQSLIVKTVGSSTGGTVSISGGNVLFTPAANFNGTASFQYTVEDDGTPPLTSAAAATASFSVTPVADTPSVTNATTNEDTQTTTGLIITRNSDDGPEVLNFKITGITGGTLYKHDGSTQINNGDFITVAEGADVGGFGLKFTPAANSNVNGSFQVQASLNSTNAGLGGGLATATITVNPVNDAPTLDAIGNLTINEDAPLQTVNLTGINAGGGESQTLVITATSNNTGLIPDPTVNYTSPNATGSLTFTPVADQNGSALVTVTVNDGGGVANGGVQTVVRTFTVTVNAVNDAPVNSVPGSQTTDEDIPLTFSAANSNLISISDGDAGAAALQVTLTATNGTLTLPSTAGLIFTTGDGTADATMTFSGTLASINAALNSLVFTPTAGFNGAASVQITTNDQGNTGAGGALSDTDDVSITVDQRALRFSSAPYTVGEADGHATITVTRTGGTSNPASVEYETSDLSGLTNCDVVTGNASARCDYTAVGGTLHFPAGVSSLTFTVPVINDVYVEGPETLTLTLSNPVGGILGTPSVTTLTITDNDDPPGGAPNPIDDPEFFIEQLYRDILSREGEPQGLHDWHEILTNCPAGDTHCDRIQIASDFFRSPEFFERSYFIYRFYEVALGRHPLYEEYQHDIRCVMGFLTDAELEQRKLKFIAQFMQKQEFRDHYDSLQDPLTYVSALLTTAGVVSTFNGQPLIAALSNGTMTRAEVLRAIVESDEVSQRFYNKAFVVVGYFVLLRRDPDIAYLFWLNKLNTTGNYRDMIIGFINSPEYRARFGP